MIKYRTLLIFIASVLTSFAASAQNNANVQNVTANNSATVDTTICANGDAMTFDNYKWTSSPILNLEPGKKVMYVQDLELPRNTTLGEILQMFPELITRDDQDILKNFDLQIDDISSGNSKEIMLTLLRSNDIKSIELSVNPTTSTQIVGQGGVINVCLMKPEKEGFSGTAMIEASSMWDVYPAFKFKYVKDKLLLKGSASGEFYQPRNNNSEIVADFHEPINDRQYIKQFDDYKYGCQFANLHMEYYFTDHDRLKMWIWENYNGNSHNATNYTDSCGISFDDKINKTLNEIALTIGANYEYKHRIATVEAELTYRYSPGNNNRNTSRSDIPIEEYHDYNYPHSLNGFAKSKFHIVPEKGNTKLDLTVGFNANYSPKTFSFTDAFYIQKLSSRNHMLEVSAQSLYLSPYLEFEAKYGPCFFKGGVRYQFYQYDIAMKGDDEFKKPTNKVTGFLNFGWQVAPHHHLSIILDKSLKRPDNQQVYPFVFYDPDNATMILGNPYLTDQNIYTFSADYQYDFSKNGHTVLAGCGLRYNFIEAIITGVDGIYHSYVNDGFCDVINANVMAIYGHGPFKIFVTGNVLQNWSTVSGTSDSNFSYNISVSPMLSFKEGWRISANFEYNSDVITLNQKLGQYFYSEVRLSKDIKNWDLYMKLTDNFHDRVTDIDFSSSAKTVYTSHYLHFPGLGIGAGLSF